VIEPNALIASYTRKSRCGGKTWSRIRNYNINRVILFYWVWATRPRDLTPAVPEAQKQTPEAPEAQIFLKNKTKNLKIIKIITLEIVDF